MTTKEIEQYIRRNAKDEKYELNEDMAPMIAKGLKAKLDKFGDLYCPCVLERSVDTICPCNDFKESEETTCHCQLYTKK